ncbi:MAG: flagellar biosynthesis anti-sigma factor FlgM [Candidatus Wallbacteria bacterium]|nr:flagellar biosynthesis anti-sigma factor FlgM [Candidatus Wallbacteria bacterium]
MSIISKDSIRIDQHVKTDKTSRTHKKDDFQKVLSQETEKIDDSGKIDQSTSSIKNADLSSIIRVNQEVALARAVIDSTPEIREDLVKQIKQEIQNGTYKIELDSVADNMIKSGVFDDLL